MKYDLLVIGSGPGGYVAAIRAGQYGLKVGVIEKDEMLGGTCLHVGCIPTKALLHYAELYEHALNGEQWGIKHTGIELEYKTINQRKTEVVVKHAKGVEFLFKKNKVESIRGYGRLLGGGKVEVTDGDERRTLSAKNIILASGSVARMLPGMEVDPKRILTNIEILDLKDVPKSLAIIGAGAVGVEFASIFRSFGSEVTILEMLPRLVPIEDEDVSKELARVFKKKGIQIEVGAKVDKVKNTRGGVDLDYTDAAGEKKKLSAQKLLVAVGRKPNTDNVGIENTKIKMDRDFVITDEWMQTGESGVYAIGDIVAGTPQLAHVAMMEGLVAVGRIAGKDVEPVDYARNPSATYCEPQVASVGLTEAKAREQGHKVKVGKFPFAGNSKASILGSHGGFVKVVADEKYGEILGVHIIGPSATELVSEAVVAMTSEATVESMMTTIHAHPTLAEAVQEGFNSVAGLSINA